MGVNSIPGVMIKIPSVECRSQLGLCYSALKRCLQRDFQVG